MPLRVQSEALEGILNSNSCGPAWQTHSAHLRAAEQLVVEGSQPAVLRCHAFWRCVEAWSTLRFADHRGQSPSECYLTTQGVVGQVTHTKTTGPDKTVQSRLLNVDLNRKLVVGGVELVGVRSVVDERLPPASTDPHLGVMGAVRVPLFARGSTLASSGVSAELPRRSKTDAARGGCGWEAVAGPQPQGVHAKLHKLPPLPQDVADALTVASVRADGTKENQ